MLSAGQSTRLARSFFLAPLPTPLISSDLMYVLHNKRGMSSSLLLCLGDIIFLLPEKVHFWYPHLGSSAFRPQLIGSLWNFNWEQIWLHTGKNFCIVSLRSIKGTYSTRWSFSVIIFPTREENRSFPSNTLIAILFLLQPSKQVCLKL